MNLSRNYKDLLICFDQTISTNKPCDLNKKKSTKKKCLFFPGHLHWVSYKPKHTLKIKQFKKY